MRGSEKDLTCIVGPASCRSFFFPPLTGKMPVPLGVADVDKDRTFVLSNGGRPLAPPTLHAINSLVLAFQVVDQATGIQILSCYRFYQVVRQVSRAL